ncbi:DEAD/DEAH box helicase [Thecamonas trahens ATCC 50062]|uniref:DEAD/DEAH box helicase n=1 Tax=Thecamonas trahens ATCC 50062 TaxID=461836 RepID=A0A0L0DEW3_THETB|nr:DEAD/DEAH box helicase [Thecamonas trahens ATCC 50062]KNC50877.1 DEAD/DEAH box helicase [Thecamonas trahens ATCC 50062]|eukprot:XP_013756584.1 DEAD/DEAH box helicase [Thecamonas trahens ATCC 50062]
MTAEYTRENYEAKVSDFYSGLKPRFLNLLSDVGASELALLELDSLLLTALDSAHVDWTNGGSILHVVFAVERFLASLRTKGVFFRVVMFVAHESLLWSASPLMRLVRSLVVLHLRLNTDVNIDVLDSWFGPEWDEYLIDKEPAFIVVHEGTTKFLSTTFADADAGDEEEDKGAFPNPEAARVLHAFVLKALLKRFHCVFAAGLSERNNTISGFVVRAESEFFSMKPILPIMDAVLVEKTAAAQAALAEADAALASVPEAAAAAVGADGVAGASVSYATGVAAVKSIVAAKAQLPAELAAVVEDLARIFLLSLAFVHHGLPLKFRGQALDAPVSAAHYAGLLPFVSAVAERSVAVFGFPLAVKGGLREGLAGVIGADGARARELVDLADFRLCALLLNVCTQKPSLATGAIDDWGVPAEVVNDYAALAGAAGLAAAPLLAVGTTPTVPHQVSAHTRRVRAKAAAEAEALANGPKAKVAPSRADYLAAQAAEAQAAAEAAATPAGESSSTVGGTGAVAVEADGDGSDDESSSGGAWDDDLTSSDDGSDGPAQSSGKGGASDAAGKDEADESDGSSETDDAYANAPEAPRAELLYPVHNELLDAITDYKGVDLSYLHPRDALTELSGMPGATFFDRTRWNPATRLVETYLEDEVIADPEPMDKENISWLNAGYKALLTFEKRKRTQYLKTLVRRIYDKDIKTWPEPPEGSTEFTVDDATDALRKEVEEDIRVYRRQSKFLWHVKGESVKLARKHANRDSALRGDQKYTSFLHKYAESLTGSLKMHANPIIMKSNDGASSSSSAPKARHHSKKGSSKGKKSSQNPEATGASRRLTAKQIKALSKTDRMKYENELKRNRERLQHTLTQWVTLHKQAQATADHAFAINELVQRKFLDHVAVDRKTEVHVLKSKASLYTLARYCKLWREERKAASELGEVSLADRKTFPDAAEVATAVTIFRLVFDILNTYGPSSADYPRAHNVLDEHDVTGLVFALRFIGLGEVAAAVETRVAGKLPSLLEILGFSDDPAERTESDESVINVLEDGARGFGSVEEFLEINAEDNANFELTSVGLSSARFQLVYQGHLMERPRGLKADPRAKGFVPDEWQVKLLDAVDRNDSALVSAPTSSGKTYVSFYCMESVLTTSHSGVAIYIAPTKALVNQVAADVYARFGNKDYPQTSAGMSVYGVLITVPEMLEQLLLSSAPKVREWTTRIKYCIFDEVHSINKSAGKVWERLLLLISSPFLALSATIGNPDEFCQWLRDIQNAKREQELAMIKLTKKEIASGVKPEDRLSRGYGVTLVKHPHRWADLKKTVFLPSPSTDEDRTVVTAEDEITSWSWSVIDTVHPPLEDINTEAFVPVHPCATLTTTKLSGDEGVPGNLAFEPPDTLALYDRMVEVSAEDGLDDTELTDALVPESVFPIAAAVTRDEARGWELDVKARLEAWMREGSESSVGKVLAAFSRPLNNTVNARVDEALTAGVKMDSDDFLKEHFVEVVTALAATKRLPAIAFNFSQEMCVSLAATVISTLMESEAAARQASSAQRSAKRAARANKKAAKMAKRNRDKKTSKNAEEEAMMDDLVGAENQVDEDVIDTEAFTLVAVGSSVDTDDINAILRGLQISNDPAIDDILKEGLLRGVGVHHAGLPRKYREAVERLFRAHYLKLVVATETLALGIHMPCKTVVFAGDSIYLDSLQYRQMAGRAGRRGFDHIGHVVFYGVALSKVNRLLSAETPHLRGHYPLSDTLVLRLLSKGKVSDDATIESNSVINAAATLMDHPLYALSSTKSHIGAQMRLHFRFAVELLAQRLLVNVEGAPSGLSQMAMALHSEGPSSLALIHLLQTGMLHRLAAYELQQAEVAEAHEAEDAEADVSILMLLVCYIVGRVPVHPCTLKSKDPAASPVLPPIDEALLPAIADYNSTTLEVYTQYALKAAELVRKLSNKAVDDPEPLPVSQFEFPVGAPGAEDAYAALALSDSVEATKARSPFVALSGLGDSFLNADELASSLRAGIELDAGALPTLDVEGVHLNSYLLDFLTGLSKHDIVEKSGLTLSNVWNALNTSLIFLKTLVEGIDDYVDAEPNRDVLYRVLKDYSDRMLARFYGRRSVA